MEVIQGNFGKEAEDGLTDKERFKKELEAGIAEILAANEGMEEEQCMSRFFLICTPNFAESEPSVFLSNLESPEQAYFIIGKVKSFLEEF